MMLKVGKTSADLLHMDQMNCFPHKQPIKCESGSPEKEEGEEKNKTELRNTKRRKNRGDLYFLLRAINELPLSLSLFSSRFIPCTNTFIFSINKSCSFFALLLHFVHLTLFVFPDIEGEIFLFYFLREKERKTERCQSKIKVEENSEGKRSDDKQRGAGRSCGRCQVPGFPSPADKAWLSMNERRIRRGCGTHSQKRWRKKEGQKERASPSLHDSNPSPQPPCAGSSLKPPLSTLQRPDTPTQANYTTALTTDKTSA